MGRVGGAEGVAVLLWLAAGWGGDRCWTMVAAKGEALQKPPRSIGAPYMVFKPSGAPLAEWCDRWLLAGPTHHMAVWYGDHVAVLKALAAMLDIGFEEV